MLSKTVPRKKKKNKQIAYNLCLILAGVTVKNIPTREIIPPVYFCVRKSVKNILRVCFRIRQYVMGNTYNML